jgi:hypothetical protein
MVSPEFGQEVLLRVGDGQKPEDVARQLGRTPATIRHCLSMIEENAPTPTRRLPLVRRAAAFWNEVLASFVSRRESRYARETTRELLRLHWIVSASHPGLPRRIIYRKVVMARTGCDEYDADMMLRRAEQSFASWPTERDLTFSDVVHYLAVSEYLTTDDRLATQINMGKLVAGRVPADL